MTATLIVPRAVRQPLRACLQGGAVAQRHRRTVDARGPTRYSVPPVALIARQPPGHRPALSRPQRGPLCPSIAARTLLTLDASPFYPRAGPVPPVPASAGVRAARFLSSCWRIRSASGFDGCASNCRAYRSRNSAGLRFGCSAASCFFDLNEPAWLEAGAADAVSAFRVVPSSIGAAFETTAAAGSSGKCRAINALRVETATDTPFCARNARICDSEQPASRSIRISAAQVNSLERRAAGVTCFKNSAALMRAVRVSSSEVMAARFDAFMYTNRQFSIDGRLKSEVILVHSLCIRYLYELLRSISCATEQK